MEDTIVQQPCGGGSSGEFGVASEKAQALTMNSVIPEGLPLTRELVRVFLMF